MGTDRSELECGCPCGKGKIEAVHETPDHGWSSGQWERWDVRINCDECSEQYAIDERTLVPRADYERKVEASGLQAKAERELERMPVCGTVRQELARRLDSMRSKAARYRWVFEELGIEHSSSATFSKHWQSGEHYASRLNFPENILKVAEACGVATDELRAKVAEIKGHRDAASAYIRPIKTGFAGLRA